MDRRQEYYCPNCGNVQEVMFFDMFGMATITFETCECDKCGGIMLKRDKNIIRKLNDLGATRPN